MIGGTVPLLNWLVCSRLPLYVLAAATGFVLVLCLAVLATLAR